MANPLRGEVAVNADGTAYMLTVDINVLCELEAETGQDATGLADQLGRSPSFSLLRSVFRATLQPKHPGTTLIEAGSIMSAIGVEEIGAKLGELFKSAFPQAKPGDEGKGAKGGRKAGTGSTS